MQHDSKQESAGLQLQQRFNKLTVIIVALAAMSAAVWAVDAPVATAKVVAPVVVSTNSVPTNVVSVVVAPK